MALAHYNLVEIQNFLVNFSFIVLFFAMLFYWLQTYFSSLNRYLQFGIYAVFLANLSIALFLIIRWNQSGHFPLSNLYESLVFLSWGLTFIHLILDQQLSKDFSFFNFLKTRPLSRKYHLQVEARSSGVQETFLPSSLPFQESTTFEPLARPLARTIQESTPFELRTEDSLTSRSNSNKNPLILLGSILVPSALFINVFASFTLPEEMRNMTPLVPALQSNWLMMHVTVMMVRLVSK